ncbi:MAG: hypothetical protein H7Z73_01500 [Candidatus Saccharibacteria bacterium]|nr:hypothetical protein [Moraxellaceae bacterium]
MTAIRKTEMFIPTETVLELVQLQAGVIELRSAGFAEEDAASDEVAVDLLALSSEGAMNADRTESSKEPLVTIKFSDVIQEALGDALQGIGQQMIQAALSALMEQQSAKWHAQVMDECPAHYS